VSESDGVSDGVGSRQTPSLPSFRRTKKSIRRKPMGFGFSGLFDFLKGELVIFFAVPPRVSSKGPGIPPEVTSYVNKNGEDNDL